LKSISNKIQRNKLERYLKRFLLNAADLSKFHYFNMLSVPSDIILDLCYYLDAVSIVRFRSSCKIIRNCIGDKMKHRIEPYEAYFKSKDWGKGLEKASEEANTPQINFFISKGVSNVNLDIGMNYAAKNNDMKLINFFIEKGARDWNQGLYGSAVGGHLHLIRFFVDKGANDLVYGFVASAKSGNIEALKFLIEKGSRGWNAALIEAVLHGHKDMTKILIEKGACNWYVAMYCAARYQDISFVNFLIQMGATDCWYGGLEGAVDGHQEDLVEFFSEKIKQQI
jgi:hypothetical protein